MLKQCLIINLLSTVLVQSYADGSKSTSILVNDINQTIITVNSHNNSVSFFNVGQPESIIEIPVGRSPQAASISASGDILFVTNRADASLSILDTTSLSEISCLDTGVKPYGVVNDERYIYVANQGSNSISVYSQNVYKPLMEITVDRAPKGLTLDSQNNLLFVTHFFSGDVSIIDTRTMHLSASISNISTGNVAQTLILDSVERRAYIPHTLSNASNKALIFDNTVFPVVSVLDLDTLTLSSRDRMFLDIVDKPVGLPIDAVLHSSGKLFVANAASNDITVLDSREESLLAHIEVGANPRGVALSSDESHLFVSNSLDGSVAVIDTETYAILNIVEVSQIDNLDPVVRGKKLFNSSDSTQLARDQWIACATCHFDAEHDARTWFFNDGPRNTPSLLGLRNTMPFHWSGDLDELQDVEITIRNIQAGTGLVAGSLHCSPSCDTDLPNAGRSSDLDALASYMESLTISTVRRQTILSNSESYNRGKSVFFRPDTNCASCHNPPSYTDGLIHDVGTGTSHLEAKGSTFNTPSLIGLSESAPYLHDGSQSSLEGLLTKAELQEKHGFTYQLSETEIQDLVYFLENLIPEANNSVLDRVCSGLARNHPAISARASIAIAINKSAFYPGDILQSQAFMVGFEEADLYFVLQFPDGEFRSLTSNSQLSSDTRLVAFDQSVNIDFPQEESLFDLVVPESAPVGNYTLHGLLTEPGANPFDQSNWLDYETLEFIIDKQ